MRSSYQIIALPVECDLGRDVCLFGIFPAVENPDQETAIAVLDIGPPEVLVL
jgi:hypothetical protein